MPASRTGVSVGVGKNRFVAGAAGLECSRLSTVSSGDGFQLSNLLATWTYS